MFNNIYSPINYFNAEGSLQHSNVQNKMKGISDSFFFNHIQSGFILQDSDVL